MTINATLFLSCLISRRFLGLGGIGTVVEDPSSFVVIHVRHEKTVGGENGGERFPNHRDEHVDDGDGDKEKVERVLLLGAGNTTVSST